MNKPSYIKVKVLIDPAVLRLLDRKAPLALYELLAKRIEKLPDLICVNIESRPARGTKELRIFIKPSDALLELMAAVTA